MDNIEIIKQTIVENKQAYLDWTVKVVQDKLVAQEIYITNSELVDIMNEIDSHIVEEITL